MLTIPAEFYAKSIRSYIKDLINDGGVTDFYSLDDADQDKLTSLAIEAFDGDVEICLSREANALLAKYLVSHDPDDAIEFKNASIDSAREYFAPRFDLLIDQLLTAYECDVFYETGKVMHIDRDNGEQIWI